MGRFGFGDADAYAPKSSGGYLTLKNDGDVAVVRFMYDGPDDIEGYQIHEVSVDGKNKDVNCLKESYNSPDSDCPFCSARMSAKRKYYIPVFDCDTEEVKVWTRSHNYVSKKIFPLTSEVSPLCTQEFKITRYGVAGDKQTDYSIYPVRCEDKTLADLPDLPEVLGRYLLDKSVEDMECYLENGYFPSEEESTQASGGRASRREDDEPVRRRTPASSGRRDIY